MVNSYLIYSVNLLATGHRGNCPAAPWQVDPLNTPDRYRQHHQPNAWINQMADQSIAWINHLLYFCCA